jgi:hypothetical protein
MTAKTVVDVILGEAKAGSYQDMLAIASVISNRATGGRTSFQDVVSRTSEFNAYGKPLPSGVNQYRSMAEKAIEQVKTTGPIHNATFYATPKAQGNLPKGLEKVTSTDGHIYFTDPQQRPIYTASGLKKIDYQQVNSATPQMLAYNDQGLPNNDVAPIPAGLFTAAPKGLAALVPSKPGGNLSYNHGWQEEGTQNKIKNIVSGAGKEVGKDIHVTSAHRPLAYNRKIGSGDGSYHIPGAAMDISMAGMSPRERQDLVQNMAQRGAGGFITYSKTPDMLHVDTRQRSSEFRPHFMYDRSSRNMGNAPSWFKELDKNDGVLLPGDNIPTPQPRYESSTNAAPFGKVQREELGPASITPAPSGSVTRAGSLPKATPPTETNPKARLLQAAYQKRNVPTPVARPADIPQPTYTPKASDYSNYMMNVKQTALPTGSAIPLPAPTPAIQGPVGQPLELVPTPPTRIQQAKTKATNHLKEQLHPKTLAARGAGALIGGLLGGPLGAKAGSMFGPQIAKRLNGNKQTGLFGGLFNQSNQAPMQTGAKMGSSSSEWGSSQNQGATYSASDGATITGLGNGTYSRTNPITGKSSQWNEDGSRSTKGY